MEDVAISGLATAQSGGVNDGLDVGIGERSGRGSGSVGEREFVAENITVDGGRPHVLVGDVRKAAIREIGEEGVWVAPARIRRASGVVVGDEEDGM